GLGRGVIEGLRTDSLLLGNIRISQLLAFLLVISAVAVWMIVRSKVKNAHDEEYLKLYVKTDACQQEIAAYQDKMDQKAQKKAAKKDGKSKETVPITIVDSEEEDEESEEFSPELHLSCDDIDIKDDTIGEEIGKDDDDE
ncbi:MAG: prolipoprotein diacylglyceryl transferase, partial [Oscillospiraceae bacterium]